MKTRERAMKEKKESERRKIKAKPSQANIKIKPLSHHTVKLSYLSFKQNNDGTYDE